MDPKFFDRVVRELQQLLADEEAGRQPSNPHLAQAVYKAVRETMSAEAPRLPTAR